MTEKIPLKYLALYIGAQAMIKRSTNGNGETKETISLALLALMERNPFVIVSIKPILRPLSDMTEEERIELHDVQYPNEDDTPKETKLAWTEFNRNSLLNINSFQYLLNRHFDIFNWIEKGCAINKSETR